MSAAVVIVAALAAIFIAALRMRRIDRPLVARIDALLPQTQCRQCGYAGCRPYAQAIADGHAAINRCPPGGEAVIGRLARVTGRTFQALDTSCGTHKPRQLALIDETRCIGCTLCIQACPVDAILGAPKLMHTVIAEQCTGCELCIPPCPVDCIAMEDAPWTIAERLARKPAAIQDASRRRFEARNQRLVRNRRKQRERLAAKAAAKLTALDNAPDAATARKRAIVAAALVRAREKLAAPRA